MTYPSPGLLPSPSLFPGVSPMPPPSITPSTRFMDVGTTKVYYLPAIAAASLVPTRAEMNAGTDLSTQLADWGGWTLSAEFRDTQAINAPFKTTIAGSVAAPPCWLRLYTSVNGVDVRSVLPAKTTGFIMICDGGDVTGNFGEVWPVTVATASVTRGVIDADSASANAASTILLEFAITATPAQRVSIP